MEGIIAIFFLLLILSFIWNIISKDIDRVISCFFAITCGIILTITLIDYCNKYNPTALDVYQGKTTLEITYRDSIPIDTIVVLKPEFIKK